MSSIPLSYWSAEGISYIASGIGKPLCSDEITSKYDLLNFARVCIEVNASFTFPSSINVTVLNEDILEDIIVLIEVKYQSRPPSCPTCKVFGHSPLKCPKSNFKWVPKVQPPLNISDTVMYQCDPSGLNAPPKDVTHGPPCNSSVPAAPAPVSTDWVTVKRCQVYKGPYPSYTFYGYIKFLFPYSHPWLPTGIRL